MATKVVIMQGISGSGKTTYIKERHPKASIVSMDICRKQLNGKYHYDPRQNGKLRSMCRNNFLEFLNTKKEEIAVDNTNLFEEALNWYIITALHSEAEVEVITLLLSPKIAAKRVKTGTPKDVVFSSHNLLENLLKNYKFPDGVKHTIINSQV